MMTALEDVKLLLDIFPDEEDAVLDRKLSLIIGNAQRQVLSYLSSETKEVPEELSYIVTEMAVARFNRIGNEGMSSYTQEGESITYGSDISPYLTAIQSWNEKHGYKVSLRISDSTFTINEDRTVTPSIWRGMVSLVFDIL